MPDTRKPLGLDPVKHASAFEDVDGFVRYIGPGKFPHWIREGRATFEALVPDRYKRPAEDPSDA